jgi:cobalamin biosynthesis Mg chelatase CobN
MSATCITASSLNQTNSEFNNICLLSGAEAVEASTVQEGFSQCCVMNKGTYEKSADNCYLECHATEDTLFKFFPDCLRKYMSGNIEGIDNACFGDLLDNAGTTGAPSGPTVSFNQSTATVNDNHAPASAVSASAFVTSAPMTASSTTTAVASTTASTISGSTTATSHTKATSSATATTSNTSKATTTGPRSLGVILAVSLAFLFAVAV